MENKWAFFSLLKPIDDGKLWGCWCKIPNPQKNTHRIPGYLYRTEDGSGWRGLKFKRVHPHEIPIDKRHYWVNKMLESKN